MINNLLRLMLLPGLIFAMLAPAPAADQQNRQPCLRDRALLGVKNERFDEQVV